jgi:hypothetical protein
MVQRRESLRGRESRDASLWRVACWDDSSSSSSSSIGVRSWFSPLVAGGDPEARANIANSGVGKSKASAQQSQTTPCHHSRDRHVAGEKECLDNVMTAASEVVGRNNRLTSLKGRRGITKPIHNSLSLRYCGEQRRSTRTRIRLQSHFQLAAGKEGGLASHAPQSVESLPCLRLLPLPTDAHRQCGSPLPVLFKPNRETALDLGARNQLSLFCTSS